MELGREEEREEGREQGVAWTTEPLRLIIKRISLARFSACGGSHQRYHSTPPPCDPCGAFFFHRTHFPMKEKKG